MISSCPPLPVSPTILKVTKFALFSLNAMTTLIVPPNLFRYPPLFFKSCAIVPHSLPSLPAHGFHVFLRTLPSSSLNSLYLLFPVCLFMVSFVPLDRRRPRGISELDSFFRLEFFPTPLFHNFPSLHFTLVNYLCPFVEIGRAFTVASEF